MIEYPKIETLYERDPRTHGVIETMKRRPEFDLIDRWLVTEKIDGTNIRVSYSYDQALVGAYTFGEPMQHETLRFGGRSANAQIPTELLAELQDMFSPEQFRTVFQPEESVYALTEVTLYGEGYGPKIQSGGWYREGFPSFRVFDVRVGGKFLDWDNVEDVAHKLGVETVPVLQRAANLSTAVRYVNNLSVVQADEAPDTTSRLHEGVVCRTDPLLYDWRGNRIMWKLKVKDFK